MNGVPMRFDYSKTINQQLPTFEYYKDRYCTYELEIMKLKKENQKYKEVIDKAINKLGIYADKMIDNGNAYAICVDLLHLLKEVE